MGTTASTGRKSLGRVYQDLRSIDRRLARKQTAFAEGLAMLGDARRELAEARSSANAWATASVMSQVVLIPLNILVNAFQLKAAKTTYDVVVRVLVKFLQKAKEGIELAAAAQEGGLRGLRREKLKQDILAEFKNELTKELRAKGLAAHIPGANVLLGLAEDTYALIDSLLTIDAGTREMQEQMARIDRKISDAQREIQKFGIQRAQVRERLDELDRTA
jgi:hypothetical protein